MNSSGDIVTQGLKDFLTLPFDHQWQKLLTVEGAIVQVLHLRYFLHKEQLYC